MPTRFISVDNVLQYASEIPSGQARGPPGRRPAPAAQRRPNPPAIAARVAQQNVPGRSTKVTEKLVLIPDTVNEKEESDDETDEHGQRLSSDGDEGPLKDAEMDVLKKAGRDSWKELCGTFTEGEESGEVGEGHGVLYCAGV
jgi:hypothetical protein